MKVQRDVQNRFNPYVVGEDCVQSLLELFGPPSRRQSDSSDLAGGVDPAVGAASGFYGLSVPRELHQGRLNVALDGSTPSLALPPQEVGSVIMDGESETAFLNLVHADKVDGTVGASRKAGLGTGSTCTLTESFKASET